MSRSFGLVDYKTLEAEYFLDELKRLGGEFNVAAVQYCASAFVSATRSITFAMQASMNGQQNFESWYAKHQNELRANSLAKFFHDFRTLTQHIGENVVKEGSMRDGELLFYFTACPDLPDVPETDVLSACETYFQIVLNIVYDCYIQFGNVINGQQYFTKENFSSLGKSIEDAEEDLGFPRGWTKIGTTNEFEHERWKLLRRHADGCGIEDVFIRWLGKGLS